MKKKVLLVGINAKYIHSNLAVRYLQKYGNSFGHTYFIKEFTINQRKELILSEIYKQKPDVLGFSCYIWNIEIIMHVVSDIKKIMPETVIVLGGPEILDGTFEVDYVLPDAGEKAFYELVCALEEGEHFKIPQEAFDFSQTVFPYDDDDFEELFGRIIYYEAQRGCPFNCSYCLSAAGEGVRFLPFERVCRELRIFLDKKIKLVKFVDRTFNCDKTFRRNIWNYLIENDNGVTGFHFEITAELLENEDFEILGRARKSLFQFEIGVQSTCEKTLNAINRKADFTIISGNVRLLSGLKNIHLHLDLIAGLPLEDFNSFKKSFNDVFYLKPEMLQLGFLKLLKGSRAREDAEKHGIVYSDTAPYEVLKTNDISYGELMELKNVENMLESYYNSGLAFHAIEFIVRFFKTPFDFFYSLGQFWNNKGYGHIQHSKMKMYERLFEFFETVEAGDDNSTIAKEAIIYDILLNDNIKTFPECLSKQLSMEQSEYLQILFSDIERMGQIEKWLLKFDKKQLRKQCCVAFFNYAVYDDFKKKDSAVFFHYLSEKGRGTPTVLDWRLEIGKEN